MRSALGLAAAAALGAYPRAVMTLLRVGSTWPSAHASARVILATARSAQGLGRGPRESSCFGATGKPAELADGLARCATPNYTAIRPSDQIGRFGSPARMPRVACDSARYVAR